MSNFGNDPNPFASPLAQGGYTAPAQMSGYELAGRGERFLAALIDGLIVGVISFVLGFGLGMVMVLGLGTAFMETPLASIITQGAGLLIGVACYLGINGYFLVKSGQTVGKKVMNIRVIQEGNASVPDLSTSYFKRLFITQLVSIIPILGGLYALVDAVMIFSADKRCLHDRIAGTQVIKC
jgi:uncharacterized RDD family membrane protein YckC